MKVAICIPTRGEMDAMFVLDLVQLLMATMSTVVADGSADIGIMMSAGTYLDDNREELVEAALAGKATHILFLDDDMRFPRGLLLRLLAHNRDIVGVNYAKRVVETVPVAIERISPDGKAPRALLFPRSEPERDGLVPVEAVGFGAVLIRAGVFERLPRPWFMRYFNRERGQKMGEDVDFCVEARKAGFEVLVDESLSREIRHTGRFEYTLDHAVARRELEEKEPE
jgi:hypothetical protein